MAVLLSFDLLFSETILHVQSPSYGDWTLKLGATQIEGDVASHRDGIWPIGLEKYHDFSGSKSEYQKVKRRVKSDLKKRFEDWQAEAWIEPGWDISRNDDGDEGSTPLARTLSSKLTPS